jgi:hypothetical protein
LNDLQDKCENLIRKYKVLRLVERNKLRTYHNNDINITISNTKETEFTEFINILENMLGYKVNISPDKQVKSCTIRERLDLIERGE